VFSLLPIERRSRYSRCFFSGLKKEDNGIEGEEKEIVTKKNQGKMFCLTREKQEDKGNNKQKTKQPQGGGKHELADEFFLIRFFVACEVMKKNAAEKEKQEYREPGRNTAPMIKLLCQQKNEGCCDH